MKMEPVEISILIGMNVKTNTEVGALDSAPITEDDVYDFNQLSYLLTLSKLYEFGSEALFQDTRLSDSSQDQAIIKPSREKSEQIYTAVKDYVFKKIGGDSLYFLKAEQAMLNNIAHFLNSGDASESGSSC